MCGIVGFIEFEKQTTQETLDAMTDSLIYRGPDGRGTVLMENDAYRIGLGHRRLSIIDLSARASQPMNFRELSIVFNGEIYNYPEIRKELEDYHNCTFKSNSDTEVILQAFYRWGISCVNKFIGMFSIGLYDGRDKKFYLIRDRAGVKPLYYFEDNGVFLFASELKAFHQHSCFKKEIDRESLGLFLQYGYVATPYSIFRKTKKLNPGHYIVFDLVSHTYRDKMYWDVYDYYERPKLKINYNDAIDEVKDILYSAFNYRMVSDVPVGIFLSGGYDSTTVAAILQNCGAAKIKTFTIGFKESFDEAKFAMEIAKYLRTDHTEYYCSETDAANIIPELPYFFDEPFGDSSAIPTILVSRLARKQVTVALSADGGDEIFAGYSRYHNMNVNMRRLNMIPQYLHKPIGKILGTLGGHNESNIYMRKISMLADIMNGNANAQNYNKRSLKLFSDQNLLSLIGETVYRDTLLCPKRSLNNENSDIERIMAIDFQTYLLDDILVKVDRATMSASLEGREPMLDHRIVELVAQLPLGYKYQNGVKKRILKDLNHSFLPVELMNRPKMGFGVPLARWLRTILKDQVLFYLSNDKLERHGFLNKIEVRKIIKSFYGGADVFTDSIWRMLIFQMWFEKWM